jgi:hypothetical protein
MEITPTDVEEFIVQATVHHRWRAEESVDLSILSDLTTTLLYMWGLIFSKLDLNLTKNLKLYMLCTTMNERNGLI